MLVWYHNCSHLILYGVLTTYVTVWDIISILPFETRQEVSHQWPWRVLGGHLLFHGHRAILRDMLRIIELLQLYTPWCLHLIPPIQQRPRYRIILVPTISVSPSITPAIRQPQIQAHMYRRTGQRHLIHKPRFLVQNINYTLKTLSRKDWLIS